MKINFNYIQEKQNNEIGQYDKSSQVKQKDIRNVISGISFDCSKDQRNVPVYGKQKKTIEDIKNQTSMDATTCKNYMAVMAGTLSDEDYKALIKDGVKPGKVEVSEAVTIMDHIKASMAESGIVISGFNGSGDLSMDKLESMTGDKGYAQAIATAFMENDIPLTNENVSSVMEQTEYAMQLNEISDGSKQYLLENNLSPTIDNFYKAIFSTSDTEVQNHSGYFADDLTGYYGKKPEFTDVMDLQSQIEKVIKEAGLEINDTTKQEASWILDRGLLLTSDSLGELNSLNTMNLPMDRDTIISKVAQSLWEGKQAKDTDLIHSGIYERAKDIMNQVNDISEEAVRITVSNDEPFNIRNLSRVQLEINLNRGDYDQSETMIQIDGDNQKLLHANRVFQEVRLQMTVSANILLLKSDYSIDTAELEDLVDNLRNIEMYGGKSDPISTEDNQYNLYQDTLDKTSAIRTVPAAVIGQIVGNGTQFTINNVYKQGTILQSTYEKAGQSYEALMTSPRSDMGDKIQDAFRNVDDLLAEIDMEQTKDNRRAVRILAYNQMDITKENVIKVREADTSLNNLLEQMKPWNTLKMIRDGVNPLEESVKELSAYFNSQEDLTDQTEKFSRYLYQLEQDKQISKEERDSYIGIYRLIRQVEKEDGKAIGTVISNGQELSFANLLSAVRTSQKKYVNQVIDDNFGGLDKLNKEGESISDQINSYYSSKASNMLNKLDPQIMKQNDITLNSTWDELDFITESGSNNDYIQNGYVMREAQYYREDLQSPEETVNYLISNEQVVTVDNLAAANKLLKDRGDMYRKTKNILSNGHEHSIQGDTDSSNMLEATYGNDFDFDENIDTLLDHFNEPEEAIHSFGTFMEQVNEQLSERMYSGNMEYLDIRALSLVSKQLALANNLSKEENYELPAIINGELTSVNIHFRHENRLNANAKIQVDLTNGDKVVADFSIKDNKVVGYIGSNSTTLTENMQKKQEDFKQTILSETGKEADICIIYSSNVMNSNSYDLQSAGKQLLTNKQEKTEEEQGSHTSAKELYKAAKSFIRLLNRV